MKFYYIANIRLPTEKAHGVQIMKMCEAFGDLGHEVTLIVPWRFNAIQGEPFAYYSVRKTFAIKRVFSLDLIAFGAPGFLVQMFSFACSAALYGHYKRPDLFYSRDSGVVATLSFFGLRPLIWEVHTAVWNFLAGRATRSAEKIITISNGLADFYEGHGVPKEKLSIAHDAVDAREFEIAETKEVIRKELELPEGRAIIEYVGKFRTMGHPKGVEEIIQIGGNLKHKHPELFLLIVGLNNDELPLAQEVATQAGLTAGDYRLVAHVPRHMVPRYIRAADILLMNYPNTPHYARIMSPLKVFEYMASGVPMVSSDLPSLREVLPEGSVCFVPPDDPTAFGIGIERVLDNPEYAQSLGENAHRAVVVHSWEKRAEAILQAIHP
jgi:glycosyltransferase involved in cell wall biosynthesis